MNSSQALRIPLFKVRIEESGTIRDIRENIVRIEGLPTCLSGEIIEMGDDVRGLVMEYDSESVLALVLGDSSHLRMGKTVRGVSEPFRIPVGNGCIGRMLSALGDPCDERGALESVTQAPVFYPTPSLMERRPVDEYLPTGTRIVDALTPLGKGQRQLILGDRMTGKSSIAVDAVLSQRGTGTLCIYCCVGKSVAALEKLTGLLHDAKALEYTTIMVAADNAPVAEQYIVPFSAAALGNWFASQGRDVLMVFDDLTKHAWAYRQISLLLDRPPGREAYPGDIFYVQTQLMEKAGCFELSCGGGSMSFLAIAETLQGDLTGYIPSNLSSMCDGQVYISASLYAEGMRPAVDVSLSLSIVGGRAQPPVLRELARSLRADYAAYAEILQFSRLSSGVSESAGLKIRRGEALQSIFQQGHHRLSPVSELLLLLYAVDRKHLDHLDQRERILLCDALHPYAAGREPALVETLSTLAQLTPELEAVLNGLIRGCLAEIRAKAAEALSRKAEEGDDLS